MRAFGTSCRSLQSTGRIVADNTWRLSEGNGPSIFIGLVLTLSGLFHLCLLWWLGAEWSGPLSLRKPGLFGISAGVTIWSIVWVLTQLKHHRFDRNLATLLSSGLFLEVGLITLQHWRGVPSHFNRATILDAVIESTMLALILLVTVGIGWICWRARQLQTSSDGQAIAIQAGLWMLLASCLLGVLITLIGEVNIANGKPPEIWGKSGVLKYPHGMVLHAIQILPLMAALLQRLRVARAVWLMRSAVAGHLLLLFQALWQTFHGRARTELDPVAGITLVVAGVLLLCPVIAIIRQVGNMIRVMWSNQPVAGMVSSGETP